MNDRRDPTSTHPDVLPTLVDLKTGAHLCSLYETEAEHRALLTPFLRHGLNRGEKVLYIVDVRTAETILRYLEDDGLAVQPYLQEGQLRILTVSDAYMRDGLFEPERMIALLQAETDRAVAEGYPALRVTGEMTWALRGLPGSERLIEYESKLNTFLPGSRCLALCQYDRRRFTPEVQLDILATHPMVVVGTELHDNPYYLPPAAFLAKDRPEARLEQWLNNLAARKQMEAKLRQVVHDRGERAKELTCLYQSARLLQGYTTPTTDILQELVALLPPAWQYPEITAARIILNGNQYATPNFTETQWKQSTAFKTVDGKQGEIEVVYLEAMPDEVEGPFLTEERALINAVADSLVSYQGRKQTEEAFRASEETFRAMSTSAQDAIILLDADGKITFWNQAAERIFGYPAHEVLGREMHRICAPARFHEDSLKGWDEFRLTGKGPVIGKILELAALRRDGVEFPVELSVSAVKLGGQWNAIGILRDITERKQAEEEVRRSEARLNVAQQVAHIGSWELDLGANRLLWSDEVYRIVERDPKTFGASYEAFLDTVHPEDRAMVDRAYTESVKSKTPYEVVHRLLMPDGRVKFVLERCENFYDPEGNPLRSVGTVQDITERQRTEEQIRLVTRALESAANGIVITDSEGTIFWVNPAFTKLTGYGRDEAIGQNPRLLKSGWQDQTFYRQLWNTIKAGNVWHGELVNKRKDGTVYTEEMTIAPVRDDQSVISHFVAIKQDITEHKQMERHAQRIEQLASMGQLLGGVVHELKNPLFIVTGRLQLLKEKLANREYDELGPDLQKIGDAAQRMGNIAQRFLTLARPIQPSLQVCSITTVLKGVLDFLSNELMKARIRVIADYAADLPSCLSDPAQLHQAFLNLTVNALQAMTQAHGQGVLNVSVQLSASGDRQEEQWIEARIQDDGPGIPSEHRARLFEPFFTTKPPGEGTGLGLWTVHTIVMTLNGTVTCESEVGQGATFIIRLPVTKEVAH